MPVTVEPLTADQRVWAHEVIEQNWGSTRMVSRGVLYDMTTFPGLIAVLDDQRVGLLIYRFGAGAECEIMSLDSLVEGQGVGTALLDAAREIARAAGCQRLVLITTNDNTRAFRFYQKRGWRLCGVRVGAVDDARQLKPEIPLIGNDDIPIHDEIELEYML